MKLLDILVCPETKQPLRVADEALIASLRARGVLIEAGLVRADGAVLYPVRDGVPVMLIDEAILL